MKLDQLYRELKQKLSQFNKDREASSQAFIILEHFLKVEKADVLAAKEMAIDSVLSNRIDGIVKRLRNQEPIQYIIGKADFFGRQFLVNPSVLIPRIETENLVQILIDENIQENLNILDIGTGSGCIAISLALEMNNPKVTAIDNSKLALETASQNADLNRAKLNFIEQDIFIENRLNIKLDIIVSNPPYVTESERKFMQANVLEFEPNQALFVPDDDALIFYERIMKLSMDMLKPGGKIYFEINESKSGELKQLFEDNDFHMIKITNDLSGKPRFAKARKPGN